jgi:hypothetical protein
MDNVYENPRHQYIDDLEARLIEFLGPEGFIEALSKALGYDKKEDLYEFIATSYELPEEDEADNLYDLAPVLVEYFNNNPKDGYSINEIKAYFDYKGYQLSNDEVTDIWDYCVDNNMV